MQKSENVAMSDMSDCPGMGGNSSKSENYSGKSSNVSCKACCASLIGVSVEYSETPIFQEHLKIVAIDFTSSNQLFFEMFRPPKIS